MESSKRAMPKWLQSIYDLFKRADDYYIFWRI